MCRVVSRTLAVGAAAEARALTRDLLSRWELDDLAIDATLLVSETVTNALRHAHTGATLTLAVAEGTLEVGVTDGSPEATLPRTGPVPDLPTDPAGWEAEGGRGLRLLDVLADTWGVVTLAEGKQVWFRVSVPEQWPYRTSCPCGGEDLDTVRLESGARALAVAGPWDQS